jgi:MoaA/NifB/PqqE/SkfB family radical SAM enzyme
MGKMLKPDYSKLFDMARDVYALPSYKSNSGAAFMPLRYSLELTYRCNLSCPYCYVGNFERKEELSASDWKAIINQIPFYGLITLVGGEPLIRKDFDEIFDAAIARVLGKVNVVTNGVLLHERILKTFIDKKLLLLGISLDGYEKNHDRNRNKEGLFANITENLDILKSLKRKEGQKPHVDIKTIIFENNLDDLPKIYTYCEYYGADFLSLSFLRTNLLKQNANLRDEFLPEFYESEYPIVPYFDMEHFKEVYKELASLSENSRVKIRWAPKFDYFDDKLGTILRFLQQGNNPVENIYKPCMYPWSNVIITPYADMYPCLSYKIGNVKDKPVKEVWNSPKFKCFRNNLKTRKVFNSCQMCCELTPELI